LILKILSYKLPGIDKILPKLIQASSEELYSEVHKPIHPIWNKSELPHQWVKSIIEAAP
jgi:hypothetical protein